jgi:predicted DNA-binding transcriptional regulator YafY
MMTYSERKEKENYLLYLIEHKRLTDLGKVANDFECSVRTIKRMLSTLRNEGKPITYCRKSNKYLLKK